jgi:hypothetical protein
MTDPLDAVLANLARHLTIIKWTMGVGFVLVTALLLLALYWMWPLIQRLP